MDERGSQIARSYPVPEIIRTVHLSQKSQKGADNLTKHAPSLVSRQKIRRQIECDNRV
jgi:hypothetical protein